MRLIDILNEAPIKPTARFVPFHGNYCGPGNRGGRPIDALDKACFRHDCEYDRSYNEDAALRLTRQIKADLHFIERTLKVAADKSISKIVRLKAFTAAKYFMRRVSQQASNAR